MDLAGVLEPLVIVEVGPAIGRGSNPQALEGSVAEPAGPRTVVRILKDTSTITRGNCLSVVPACRTARCRNQLVPRSTRESLPETRSSSRS